MKVPVTTITRVRIPDRSFVPVKKNVYIIEAANEIQVLRDCDSNIAIAPGAEHIKTSHGLRRKPTRMRPNTMKLPREAGEFSVLKTRTCSGSGSPTLDMAEEIIQ